MAKQNFTSMQKFLFRLSAEMFSVHHFIDDHSRQPNRT